MDYELTKDADTLICVLYKAYSQKRESGESKADAKSFGSSKDIHKEYLPKWAHEDVAETCRELDRADMLDCFYADNIPFRTSLSDTAIIYMENRFERNTIKLLDYIKKLPFV